MPNTAASMARVTLPTAIATQYTVPGSTTAIVTEIVLSNTTAADINATVEIGGLTILPAMAIPANGFLSFGLKQVLPTGSTIRAFAAAAGINMFVSGVHVT